MEKLKKKLLAVGCRCRAFSCFTTLSSLKSPSAKRESMNVSVLHNSDLNLISNANRYFTYEALSFLPEVCGIVKDSYTFPER